MKYGILGIGQAGLRHFEAFKKIKNLKLIGFIENNLSKAKSFEKKFKAKHCKKLKDLLLLKPNFIVCSLSLSLSQLFGNTFLPPFFELFFLYLSFCICHAN